MLILLLTGIGVIQGMRVARKLGGNRLDMLQYATCYGLAFGLGATFISIVFIRLFGP